MRIVRPGLAEMLANAYIQKVIQMTYGLRRLTVEIVNDAEKLAHLVTTLEEIGFGIFAVYYRRQSWYTPDTDGVDDASVFHIRSVGDYHEALAYLPNKVFTGPCEEDDYKTEWEFVIAPFEVINNSMTGEPGDNYRV